MAGSIGNSLSLVRSSAAVLAADKELLVFPLISGLASMLVVATFVAPAALLGLFGTLAEGGLGAYAFGFLFYLAQYTVIFFFNTALVGAALIRLDGGDPTVGDGMRIAFDRFGTIVEYAALAATVGMVLRFIAERTGFVGRMVALALGVVLLVMCQAALKGIYSAALYRYATTGRAGYGFDDGLMARAFATKG